ncbi:protein SIP5-like [Canna indica]|uniref:Protein SIP5-like n=1 Tax=Canna indica TaxID=4628 RepID=A0AAQ3KR10_9LILI|nr:protein SIP5-like [Canna indica]
MGNRISGARRRSVEDRLTRPQRLLRQPPDVDYNKLRKLILARKLAPCFDALEEPPNQQHPRDLEECPICFFYYPSLNRSRCCSKGICTECFLQMKPSDVNRHVQCPFCKTTCYAVEYRGARTEEEKEQEQFEEQKFIEAQLRMQCESQNVVKVIPSGSDHVTEMSGLRSSPMQVNNNMNCSLETCNNRNINLRLNLEEIMVMEAIWDSFQDSRLRTSGDDHISASNDFVESESVTHEMISGTFSHSSAEVLSSTDELPAGAAIAISRLPEQNLLQPHISKADCERNKAKLNPNGSSSEEPNSRLLLLECLAESHDSDEEFTGYH